MGNEHAKYMYEKIGFIETDIVNEDGVHEVNLKIYYKITIRKRSYTYSFPID
ncbi:MAG: hypothetical protein ACRCX2_02890 [Paraclostridium sp.]